jgi:hypothetical protein
VKEAHHTDLVTPVSAFVTFEQEEGMERCLLPLKLLGEKVKARKAAEPTDIVWENREITRTSRLVRFLLIASAVSLIMLVCFSTIVGLQQ